MSLVSLCDIDIGNIDTVSADWDAGSEKSVASCEMDWKADNNVDRFNVVGEKRERKHGVEESDEDKDKDKDRDKKKLQFRVHLEQQEHSDWFVRLGQRSEKVEKWLDGITSEYVPVYQDWGDVEKWMSLCE
jgi:hypothetical protein